MGGGGKEKEEEKRESEREIEREREINRNNYKKYSFGQTHSFSIVGYIICRSSFIFSLERNS